MPPRRMASRAQAGDRMIAGNGLRSIEYYLERAGADVIPPPTTAGDVLADPSAGRVWLVMTQSAAAGSLRERMAVAFDTVEEHEFGGFDRGADRAACRISTGRLRPHRMENERHLTRAWLAGRLSEEHRASLLSWLPWLGLILPMLALLLLALQHLGTPSLWRDEVSSVVFAKGSLGELLTIIGRDRDEVGLANMATYYLLLHFWLAVGETEARIRLLSVLFGVASVVPVYFIARRLGGWLAAALAAGIFALIPYVIHYSQEARGYSLAMLIGGALTWLVLIGVERGRQAWWPWLAYGLIAALGLYVHFFLALVVAAHGLWLLATRQVPGWRGIAAGGIPLLLAAAPIPFIIAQFGSEHAWIPRG